MLIKSPLNYIGGKYRILPQLLRFFPEHIDICYDLFSGGCNVGVNVNAGRTVCNDTQREIINLFKTFQKTKKDNIVDCIRAVISDYSLSNSAKYGYSHYGCDSSSGLGKYNKPQYEKLRSDFNKCREHQDDINHFIMFYTLIVFAFNNQIRFNANRMFNMPVGKRDFNTSIHKKLTQFTEKIQNTDIEFTNRDFTEFADRITCSDFVYCDPPYLITCATYNENKQWTEQNEKELLCFLDQMNSRNIRFALSNLLYHKNRVNTFLKEWSKSYTIHVINSNYRNCNYQLKNRTDKSTCEVLVTNY